ncbi:hemolysin family protein [Geomesophilobacter sediminis]|uniref:HlyC/CorC family transporter n=1 Tax=Geomesophilobacter sediminis TaxID=2798584 RepID=A0A8J7M1R5_9BACT|nr:hemolysin family protein [Geomesophilobacter sediminis]MBJ6726894.1 HlyC/CorC family transporter [Geomesophilobacter sediminis]
MDTVFLELTAIFILVCINGFFACSEFAVISVRKSKIAQLVDEGDPRAVMVETLQKDPHRLLAIVQIGMTLIGSTASTVGGVIAVDYLRPLLQASSFAFVSHAAEPIAVSLVVMAISYLLLILGELVPKTLGLQYADTISLRISRPITVLARVAGPLVVVLTASSKAVLRLMGVKGEGQGFMTREEVAHIVAEGHESGIFSETEHEFIENVFDFTHTSVREVMVPRTRVVAFDIDFPKEEILNGVLDNQYSRYPVYRGTIEEIVGFIHGKDLLGRMVREPDFDIRSIVRPPFFVPEGKKVSDLLKEMQKTRIHMAVVVDEYGGISGIVTTEDLLEELVGEIEDEHDIGEPSRVEVLADGSYLVDALISISDLEDLLEIKLGEDLPYDTLAGLVLDRLGRFPENGERLPLNEYTLVCEEVTQTAIGKVRIFLPQGKDEV